jgi:hypothetical protein
MPELCEKHAIFWVGGSDPNACITTIMATPADTPRSLSSPCSIQVDTEMVQTEDFVPPPPSPRQRFAEFAEACEARRQRDWSFGLDLDIPDIPKGREPCRGRWWEEV